MAFKIILPADHEALEYLNSVIDKEYSTTVKIYVDSMQTAIRFTNKYTHFYDIDRQFDSIVRQHHLVRGLQSTVAQSEISYFKSLIEDFVFDIDHECPPIISNLTKSFNQLLSYEEHDAYDRRLFTHSGAEFDVTKLSLSKKRFHLTFDNLQGATQLCINHMSRLQKLATKLNEIMLRLTKFSKQDSSFQFESIQIEFDEIRSQLRQIFEYDLEDVEQHMRKLETLQIDCIFIRKGALNEFKELCKKYLIENMQSRSIILNHDNICKQILDFTTDKLTITSELHTIISELVTNFIHEYENDASNIILVDSSYIEDTYNIHSYSSKPLARWYVNLPVVLRGQLSIHLRGVLMMSNNKLTFRYIAHSLKDVQTGNDNIVYKGMLLNELDEYAEIYEEVLQSNPSVSIDSIAIKKFESLHNLKSIAYDYQEFIPEIDQILEINLA